MSTNESLSWGAMNAQQNQALVKIQGKSFFAGSMNLSDFGFEDFEEDSTIQLIFFHIFITFYEKPISNKT